MAATGEVSCTLAPTASETRTGVAAADLSAVAAVALRAYARYAAIASRGTAANAMYARRLSGEEDDELEQTPLTGQLPLSHCCTMFAVAVIGALESAAEETHKSARFQARDSAIATKHNHT